MIALVTETYSRYKIFINIQNLGRNVAKCDHLWNNLTYLRLIKPFLFLNFGYFFGKVWVTFGLGKLISYPMPILRTRVAVGFVVNDGDMQIDRQHMWQIPRIFAETRCQSKHSQVFFVLSFCWFFLYCRSWQYRRAVCCRVTWTGQFTTTSLIQAINACSTHLHDFYDDTRFIA